MQICTECSVDFIGSDMVRFQQVATEDQSTSVEVANGTGDRCDSQGGRALLEGWQAPPDSHDAAVPMNPFRYDIA
jgi:hypothetical protein